MSVAVLISERPRPIPCPMDVLAGVGSIFKQGAKEVSSAREGGSLMQPASCKHKGSRAVKWFADKVVAKFKCHPDDCKPGVVCEAGRDIHLSPAFRERFPYSVEVKNTERLQIWAALDQSIANCSPDLTPLLVFSRNNKAGSPSSKTVWVVLSEDAFLDLAIMRDWCRE